jgi:hypothetical protein
MPNEFLEDYVTLVHGDLATKERIDALRKMRVIEHNAKNRLDWVLFVLGMFHLKMACADAFWRVHVIPKAGRSDATGFFEYVRHLWPRETGKFVSLPGFRCMHDTIHHMTWADIVDCWHMEAICLGFASLQDFAESDPEWRIIEETSEQMVCTYLPGQDFQNMWERPETE